MQPGEILEAWGKTIRVAFWNLSKWMIYVQEWHNSMARLV
jgi:hypothetical protein